MTRDNYTESIDWDIIYRAFHDPKGIATRISHELVDKSATHIFSGFPEVASYLAEDTPILFVDYSPVITARSRERYPNISQIIDAEITDILKINATRNVIISCRLSAFWQSPEAIEAMAFALHSYPREQVLIDFFDRDAVCSGMHINYESKAGTGRWNFKDIAGVPSGDSMIQIANIDISYAVGSMRFSYETRRAFFRKAAIVSWCKETFTDYEVTFSNPLLGNDPSFLIKLQCVG